MRHRVDSSRDGFGQKVTIFFFSNVYVVELWGTLIPENESYKWKAFVDVSADCHTERAEKFHNVLIVFHRRLWFFFTISESQHTERRRTKLDVELWVTLERITVSKWETRPFISLPCTHGARKISVFLANVRNIFSHPLRFRFFTRTVVLLRNRSDYRGIRFFCIMKSGIPTPSFLFLHTLLRLCARTFIRFRTVRVVSIDRTIVFKLTLHRHVTDIYIQGPFTWVRLVTEKIW